MTTSDSVAAAQTYTATAYCLRGRTASGKPVNRGLIAADPSVLPLGTRVRVEAGSWSGEYVVEDTGGAVKGRRIDIWTPTTREALQFGRRPVKLTVLELGRKRGQPALIRSRRVNDSVPATLPAAQNAAKQDK
ncbi:MAG TPA: 3D domain-containing protein [Pyrinomonadaceae bacterium]|nr:3D domain-containing protein [Pyrinomonadaceae bacterium]